MKKSAPLLTLMALALALASCSTDVADNFVTCPVEDNLPVGFNPYMTTRATDVITTSSLKTRGFGVFAYQQGSLTFNQFYTTSGEPNFMKDQLVICEPVSGLWTYDPPKYWSNNPGEKHSYFAYAPYFEKNGTSPVLNHNYPQTPSLVLDGVNEGPAIYYSAPTNLDEIIDLCWGDYNNTGHAAIDLLKPSVNDSIHFTFRHALSRVSFNAQIWTDEVRGDQDHASESTPVKVLDDGTKITIKSVKLIGTMATSGTLCLNNGKWNVTYTANKQLEMANSFKKGTSLAPEGYLLDNIVGEQYLFGTSADYFTVIPGSAFKIRVEYSVETTDSKLEAGKVVTTNTYETDQSFTMVAGKAYAFHLNIGMTSVKINAEVSNWALTPDYEEIDVPSNK